VDAADTLKDVLELYGHEVLGLSVRHVEWLYRAYNAAGAAALISKRRGSLSAIRNRLRCHLQQFREAASRLARREEEVKPSTVVRPLDPQARHAKIGGPS
jgi:hypothetical protein